MVLAVGFMEVRPGKMEELNEVNKAWPVLEERLGLPPEREYRCLFSGHDMNTVLLVREWGSMAAAETAHERGGHLPRSRPCLAPGRLRAH